MITTPASFDALPLTDPGRPPAVVGARPITAAAIEAPASETDIGRAAAILDEIISDPSPATAVARHLNDLEALLPALMELNIAQARAAGRLELASALQGLCADIHLPVPALETQPPPTPEPEAPTAPSAPRPRLAVTATQADAAWLSIKALGAQGYDVAPVSVAELDLSRPYDAIIVHQPQAEPDLVASLPAWAAAGTKIIISLDDDYEQMPSSHADYPHLGLRTRARQQAYQAALQLADAIVVSSQTQAEALLAVGRPAWVVPPGWDGRSSLWDQPTPRRTSLNIGWAGVSGDPGDLAEARRPLTRLIREFPDAQLVILGDLQAYQLFNALPDDRRRFLPPVGGDDYLYALRQIDILVVPLKSTTFNRARSDRHLLEAGLRCIPWVASPNPAHCAWGAGGLIAASQDDWYRSLRRLIVDPDLRATLGEAGRRRAEEREANCLGSDWLAVVDAVLRHPDRACPAAPSEIVSAAPQGGTTQTSFRLKPEVAAFLFGPAAAEPRSL